MRKILGIVLIFAFHSFTAFAQSGLFINEFLASNHTVNVDPDFSKFPDWIEIYNDENNNVDLSGYYLTDDLSDPEKWQIPAGVSIPAKGYLIFWCDKEDMADLGLHTNFKLSAGGEEIGLANQNGVFLDTKTFGDQVTDISCGRQPDGNGQWFYFAQPTPGASNVTTGYPSLVFSSAPVFSMQGGIYASPVQVALSASVPDASIRYTTDGSTPYEDAQLYSGPVQINNPTVIRARVFESGKLPGAIITQSFIIDSDVDLPVFSVTTNPDFLWGEEEGIYVYNDLERRKDWKRPVHMEFFESPGNTGFVINADIRLFGNTAYLLPQKSLAVFPDNTLNYHLFPGKELTKFESFILRSSSDDWSSTMFRDAMIQSLIPGYLLIDYQAYRPSVVFLNGQYYGIHNVREKYNKDYLAANHGVNPDNIDLLMLSGYSSYYEVLEGDAVFYDAMMDFILNNDMSLDENYETVKTMMDVDDFMDWCIMENFIKNHSWKHNIKIWRPRTADGRFKWLLYDTDRGYISPDDTLIADFYASEPRFQRLMDNTHFRNEFLQRYASHINITFGPGRVNDMIDSLKSAIESEMPQHILRWADSGGVQSMDYWNGQVDVMRNFADTRKDHVRDHVNDFFQLNGTATLTVNISEFDYGTVKTCGIAFPESGTAWVYFKGVPIRLEAIPDAGYEFVGWEGISNENEIYYTLEGNSTVTAVFEPMCELPEVITQDLYLLEACSPYIVDHDVTVEAGATLFAEPGVEIKMGNDKGIYVYGGIDFTGSLDNPVIITSQQADNTWKGMNGQNAGLDLMYVNVSNGLKTISGEDCEVHLSYCSFSEPTTTDYDMVSFHGGNVVIDHCSLYGSPVVNTYHRDGIDCDAVSSGIFTNNNIYDITDDGVDVGTNAENITIENNYIKNCESMGISVGEATTASIRRNIIVGCEGGIQVHTDAVGYIVNNTLYGNEVSLKCYHYDNQPASGGTAYVVNTIFSASSEADFTTVENSVLEITYSISDTDTLPGSDNLSGDPGFVDPLNNDFNLDSASPCIDAGDPDSAPDPDGTCADIGALYYDQQNTNQITEAEKVVLFPNPAKDIITVKLSDNKTIADIYISDVSGMIVLTKNNINSDRKTIRCDHFKKGIYFLIIKTTDNQYYKKKFLLI